MDFEIKWKTLLVILFVFNKLFSSLDEAQEAEVVQVLGAILELRENQAVQTPNIMCHIYFTIAMMHLVLDNFEKVRVFR